MARRAAATARRAAATARRAAATGNKLFKESFLEKRVAMKKVLIAVDDTKGSTSAIQSCANACRCIGPETVLLLYVEKFEGRSLMDEMLGEAEMSTLKNVLEGSEYKERLDAKANAVIDFHRKKLEDNGVKGIRPIIKSGHPAEEILKAAKEEGADMIIVGSRGKRTSHLFMGSVSREVSDSADVPVLIVR
jgi:nucleotide-binding universal stress UspA family protein